MNKNTHTIVWGNYRDRELQTYPFPGTQEEALNYARLFPFQGFDVVYVTGLTELGEPYYINILK